MLAALVIHRIASVYELCHTLSLDEALDAYEVLQVKLDNEATAHDAAERRARATRRRK